MKQNGMATSLVAAAAIALAATASSAAVLDVTASHDRPGPVEVQIEAKDGAGMVLSTSVLTWANDDNSFGIQSLAIPSTTMKLRMTFINDRYEGPAPDQDRNALIDFFTVDGSSREGEDWDLTGGTDSMFPGCETTTVSGRMVAACGNQNDWVEYELAFEVWKSDHPNYAPSGMPDFDQRQDRWAHEILCGPDLIPDSAPLGDDVPLIAAPPCSSAFDPIVGKGPDGILETAVAGDDVYRYDYCAPTALADCLWWFDSAFEQDLGGPPCDGADTYGLVTAYPGAPSMDDHCPDNVDEPATPPGGAPPAVDTAFGELIEDLAWRMDTGGQRTGALRSGTSGPDMESAVRDYLAERGLDGDYSVGRALFPDFDFLAEELSRSQDLILGLSFVQSCPGPVWQFVGGHAVTLAGITQGLSGARQLCLSDPYHDLAEAGSRGRVLPPPPHGHVGPPEVLHNDALLVSQDCNPLQPAATPYGVLSLPAYAKVVDETGAYDETRCEDIVNFFGQNAWEPGDPEFAPFDCDPGCNLTTVVTFALEISPLYWKADGWGDYAPSGVPDLDQRQASFTCPLDGRFSYCGPTAVANSLWWFDSVAEGPGIPPPPDVRDTHPLVQALGGWDDHDAANVEPLIALLAQEMNTDDQTPGWIPARGPYCGTYVEDMESGIRQHLFDVGLESQHRVRVERRPTIEFVADQVEKSHDVVLLLGFWQLQDLGGGPVWVRIGGHYVTVAGIERGGLVAFSDPFLNATEDGLTPGRVRGVLPHVHPGPPEIEHNDAQNVSQDVYEMVPTPSPGGTWGPRDYAVGLGPGLDNFVFQNSSDELDEEERPVGPPLGPEPIFTEVEYAIEVSLCPRPGDPDFADQDADGVADPCDQCPGSPDDQDMDGDRIPDGCDNCPQAYNPGQGPAVFGEDVFAPNKSTITWGRAMSCVFAYGQVSAIGPAYPYIASASLLGTTFSWPGSPPAGDGWWVLLRPDYTCPVPMSWDNAARDLVLP